MTNARRRRLIILFIAAIMLTCTASAVLGLQNGHTTRAASTFFAGLTFSFLLWSFLSRGND